MDGPRSHQARACIPAACLLCCTDAAGLESCNLLTASLPWPHCRRHEAYDSRADVWSFGVLLVELLTQQKPYSLTYMTPVQVAIQVADGSLRPQPPADCHPGLLELLDAVFSPDPLERPPFALIVARLEAVLRDVRAAAAAAQTQESVLGRWLGKVGKVGT